MSSLVQITLASKPFELGIPDTTQIKDLFKSFPDITNFKFFNVKVFIFCFPKVMSSKVTYFQTMNESWSQIR